MSFYGTFKVTGTEFVTEHGMGIKDRVVVIASSVVLSEDLIERLG